MSFGHTMSARKHWLPCKIEHTEQSSVVLLWMGHSSSRAYASCTSCRGCQPGMGGSTSRDISECLAARAATAAADLRLAACGGQHVAAHLAADVRQMHRKM